MCLNDCFLIFFTIRAGSACISTILLTFGLLGLLVVPFLPYSTNEAPFLLVMGYMFIMTLAFSTSLCGALTDSRKIVSTGFALAIVSFLFWLLLTLPSLMEIANDTTSNFCLGKSCGESHWFVPRFIVASTEPTEKPSGRIMFRDDFHNLDRMFDLMNSTAEVLPLEGMVHDLDSSSAERIVNETVNSSFDKRLQDKEKISSTPQEGNTSVPTVTTSVANMSELTTLTPEDEELFDLAERIVNGDKEYMLGEKIDSFLKRKPIISTTIHVEDHQLYRRQSIFRNNDQSLPYLKLPKPKEIPNFKLPLIPLNKDASKLLAIIYALLYACALGTLCMNVSSFFWSKCPKDQSPSMCSTREIPPTYSGDCKKRTARSTSARDCNKCTARSIYAGYCKRHRTRSRRNRRSEDNRRYSE